jgi:hypothetical protein
MRSQILLSSPAVFAAALADTVLAALLRAEVLDEAAVRPRMAVSMSLSLSSSPFSAQRRRRTESSGVSRTSSAARLDDVSRRLPTLHPSVRVPELNDRPQTGHAGPGEASGGPLRWR